MQKPARLGVLQHCILMAMVIKCKEDCLRIFNQRFVTLLIHVGLFIWQKIIINQLSYSLMPSFISKLG
jgi:hypothetical protein